MLFHIHKKQKWIAVSAIVLILIVFCGVTVAERMRLPAMPEDIVRSRRETLHLSKALELSSAAVVLERDGLSLSLDPETFAITLTDTRQERTLISNPADFTQDRLARGSNRARLRSQLCITYAKEDGTIESAYSATDSVAENAAKAYVDGDSLTVLYAFPATRIEISLTYSLEKGRLVVRVHPDNIKDTAENRLLSFDILPYFGAAEKNDEGYILLPDGSGSMTYFNNNKAFSERVQLSLYGEDYSVTPDESSTVVSPAHLPVYALNYTKPAEGAAFALMAYASQGELGGKINAFVAGRESSLNTAYFTFLYRANGRLRLLDRTSSTVESPVVADKDNGADVYEIEYHLLSSSQATVVGIANAVRARLFGEDSPPSGADVLPLHLEIYSAVSKQAQFLGIPYRSLAPLTTLSQTGEILEFFRVNGVSSINGVIKGLDGDGAYYGKVDTALSIPRKLGTLKQLHTISAENGVQLSPHFNTWEFTRNSRSVAGYLDAAVSIVNKRVKKPMYKLSTFQPDRTVDARYVLMPHKLYGVLSKLTGSLQKQNLPSIALGNLGSRSYSHFSKQQYGMEDTAKILAASLAKLSDSHQLVLEAPAAFALPYTHTATHLPLVSNHAYSSDHALPFVQMVLRGAVAYTSEPINEFGDATYFLLKCIESGSAPLYTMMYEAFESVQNTELTPLYGSSFFAVRQNVLDGYLYVSRALEGLSSAAVTEYTVLQDNVRRIVYANGTEIVVNYSEQSHTYQGYEISPLSYLRLN